MAIDLNWFFFASGSGNNTLECIIKYENQSFLQCQFTKLHILTNAVLLLSFAFSIELNSNLSGQEIDMIIYWLKKERIWNKCVYLAKMLFCIFRNCFWPLFVLKCMIYHAIPNYSRVNANRKHKFAFEWNLRQNKGGD